MIISVENKSEPSFERRDLWNQHQFALTLKVNKPINPSHRLHTQLDRLSGWISQEVIKFRLNLCRFI